MEEDSIQKLRDSDWEDFKAERIRVGYSTDGNQFQTGNGLCDSFYILNLDFSAKEDRGGILLYKITRLLRIYEYMYQSFPL